MGYLLAPVFANKFMGFHECKWLNEYNQTMIYYNQIMNITNPNFFLRYVDDILAAFGNKQDSLKSHTLIISQIDLYRPSLKI